MYEVWKLLKPAYGLVDFGKFWQLHFEEWSFHYGIETLLRVHQIFLIIKDDETHTIIIAKVVDDLLIAGKFDEVRRIKYSLSKRFKLCQFIQERELVFNFIRISQSGDSSIKVSMQEYMEKFCR